jgi:fructose-specific phosphotransferase system IIA component
MKLSDYLRKECCVLDLRSSAKQDAIVEIVDHLAGLGTVADKKKFVEAIMARERLGSTGIGHQVAIPHSPTEGAVDFIIGFGRSAAGIEFDAIDGEKVKLVFVLGTNPNNLNMYLKLLAKLAKLLNDESFRRELIAVQTADAVVALLQRWEVE